MLGRIFAIIAMASITSAAHADANSATPPPAMKPYLVDGTLLPGDFAWLRGSFAGASAREKADWVAITSWANNITIKQTRAVRAKLHALGVKPKFNGAHPYGDQAAALALIAGATAKEFKSWKDFQAALNEAEPTFSGYLAAMESAELTVSKDNPTLADKLKETIIGDQVGRNGMHWSMLNKPTDKPCLPFKFPEPPGCSHLSDAAAKVFLVMIIGEVKKRDHANTEMLKDIVAKSGWPKISQVGEDAAHDAWLLAQHADDDPAFQLEALQLMQPLVAKKEASGADYAYLSDRVSLVISGKQRYGTQMECVKGRMEPRTLEDSAHVDALRKSVGLQTMSEYKKMFPPTCD